MSLLTASIVAVAARDHRLGCAPRRLADTHAGRMVRSVLDNDDENRYRLPA
jgi:hypothetical protein